MGNERRTSFRLLSGRKSVAETGSVTSKPWRRTKSKAPSSLSAPKVESPLAQTHSEFGATMARTIVKLLLVVLMYYVLGAEAKRRGAQDFTELGIGVKFKPDECHLKAHKGDLVSVHYRGTLADGTEFDNSHSRGQPLDFKLGQGAVIEGWDQGILGMCVGERRKLKIPAHLAYGDESVAISIPAGASLIFDTELVAVNGRTGPGPLDVVEDLLGDINPEDDLEFGDSF